MKKRPTGNSVLVMVSRRLGYEHIGLSLEVRILKNKEYCREAREEIDDTKYLSICTKTKKKSCFPVLQSRVFSALQEMTPAISNGVDDPVAVILPFDEATLFQDIEMIGEF